MLRWRLVGLLGLASCGRTGIEMAATEVDAGTRGSDAGPNADPLFDSGLESQPESGPDPCVAVDEDGDGHSSLECGGDDCDDLDPSRVPGASDLLGDAIDENCDGTDGIDADGDAHASRDSGGDDCDDFERFVHPGAEEPEPGWVLETVDSDGTAPSLVIDARGTAQVAYAGPDGLRYAIRAVDGWSIQTLDASGALDTERLRAALEGGCAIAVDRFDQPHILYASGPGGALAYAHLEVDGWTHGIVDHDIESGYTCDVAVDDRGNVHASYIAEPNGPWEQEARYAVLSEGSWRITTVDDGLEIARSTAVAIEPDGRIAMAWDGHEFEFRFGEDAGDGWETRDLGWGDGSLDLQATADGMIHAAFEGSGVSYASRIGDEWAYEQSADEYYNIYGISLVVDANGDPHIAYAIGDELRHAFPAGGAWAVETIDVLPGEHDAVRGASVAIGPASLQIVYSGYDRHDDTELYRAVLGIADGIDEDCDGQEF